MKTIFVQASYTTHYAAPSSSCISHVVRQSILLFILIKFHTAAAAQCEETLHLNCYRSQPSIHRISLWTCYFDLLGSQDNLTTLLLLVVFAAVYVSS
jgi:hypothetical protein